MSVYQINNVAVNQEVEWRHQVILVGGQRQQFFPPGVSAVLTQANRPRPDGFLVIGALVGEGEDWPTAIAAAYAALASERERLSEVEEAIVRINDHEYQACLLIDLYDVSGPQHEERTDDSPTPVRCRLMVHYRWQTTRQPVIVVAEEGGEAP